MKYLLGLSLLVLIGCGDTLPSNQVPIANNVIFKTNMVDVYKFVDDTTVCYIANNTHSNVASPSLFCLDKKYKELEKQ